MKKLLLALLVISSLVSCGKNNKVGGNQANTNLNVPATSSVSTINSNTAFQALAKAVTDNTFGQQYAQYVNYYTEYTFGACQIKDGWFGIDYVSCSSPTDVTKVTHGTANLDTKKAELNSVLSKAVVFSQNRYSYSAYDLRTSDNITYTIDTAVPMFANPVYKLDNNTGKEIRLISIR